MSVNNITLRATEAQYISLSDVYNLTVKNRFPLNVADTANVIDLQVQHSVSLEEMVNGLYLYSVYLVF